MPDEIREPIQLPGDILDTAFSGELVALGHLTACGIDPGEIFDTHHGVDYRDMEIRVLKIPFQLFFQRIEASRLHFVDHVAHQHVGHHFGLGRAVKRNEILQGDLMGGNILTEVTLDNGVEAFFAQCADDGRAFICCRAGMRGMPGHLRDFAGYAFEVELFCEGGFTLKGR